VVDAPDLANVVMPGTIVVGREAERSAIARWLDDARPSCLLIEGEAGIGKSTLWFHAVAVARTRADRVLSWRASVAERDLAFATLTALLDEPAAEAAIDRLSGPRRAAISAAMGRGAAFGAHSDPSLVGLAVADVLRDLGRDRPLVVAIDDIQWADRASEDALAFAARRLRSEPVAVVLARRTGPAQADLDEASSGGHTPSGRPPARDLSATLAPIASLDTAIEHRTRIVVGPLSVGALGRLIHERLDVAHPRPLLTRLHEACSGNPFLGLEISRSLKGRGLEPAPGEPFPVPPEAGPLVRDHLATLSRDARRAVVIVAMSGEPTPSLLRGVLGASGDRALDEAFARGVLTLDGPRIQPTHPLFSSTAYADAPPGERRALRRALATAADDPVERAIHLAATVERPDAGVAAALADAARIAGRRGAPSVAADLLERAASLTSEPDRSGFLVEAAEAAVAAGDPRRGEAGLHAVLATVPAGRRRGEALLALGEITYVERPNDALPQLLEALEHTDDDPIFEALVHAHIASMADMDPPTGYRSAMAAVDLLEGAVVDVDPDQLACALLDRAFHWLLAGERVAGDDIDRGIALMRGGASFGARRAQELAERCLFHLGRLSEAIAYDEADHRRLTELGQDGLLPPLDQSLSVLCLMSGDWDAARRYAAECLELVEQGEEAWRQRAITARARILAYSGDLDAARAIAVDGLRREEAASDRWEGAIFCALLGFIELSVPDPGAALGYLRRAHDHAEAMHVVLPTQFRFLGDLVEAAVLAGELDLAERVLRQDLEAPGTRLPLPWVRAMAARGRGFLLVARGDLDGAVASFDAALRVFDAELPMPFERARTTLARGAVLRRAGHRRAARAEFSAALATFDGLGAHAWAARATHELGRIGGRTSDGLRLTLSERTVAELAAAGHANREIAAELVVSVRTVESQLSAVYRKLDIRSRSQLRDALASSREPSIG